jgi:exodeoxyribonuclease VII large subunit
MSEEKSSKKFYNLSQIMGSISSVINRTYSKPYWIKAEMIKLNYYKKSGHCYPDLAEKEGGKIRAQIRATLWAQTYYRNNANFVKKTGKPLSDGMNILFLAQVKHDALHGLTLNILEIDTDFELGQMAKSKMECISRLKADGIYNLNKALEFPILPKRIAVISVETSKGYHDFINILENNTRNYKYFTMLFPALLQGDAAVNSIIGQLENIKKVYQYFDIVAIIRGGGGDVGLACYDDFNLAKEVATFPIPVVSGIGHSTNETVVEMVANFNPITPTDLAYFLQQKFDNIAVRIQEINLKINQLTTQIITDENERLGVINDFVVSKTNDVIKTQNYRIGNLGNKIEFVAKSILKNNSHSLEQTVLRIKLYSKQIISDDDSYIKQIIKQQSSVLKSIIAADVNRLEHFEEKLNLLKPENLFKKGYSLTLIDGKPIKDIKEIKKGDRVVTKLYKGSFESEINNINND